MRFKVISVLMSVFLFQGVSLAHAYELDLIMPDTPEILGNSTDGMDGKSGRVLKVIFEKSGGKISHKIASSAHAYNSFYQEKYACVAPDSKLYYEKDAKYLDSTPFHLTKWVSVYRKDGTKIVSKEDLKGKRVGIAYNADALLPVVPQSGVDYKVNDDFKLNLKKLAAGRLDAVVLPAADLAEILASDASLANLTFDDKSPLAAVPDALMCHDSERGREVLAIVNKILEDIKDDLENIKAGK